MKIAVIGARGIDSNYSGVEKAVREIYSRLAARGHDITVFSERKRDSPDCSDYRGVRVERVPTLPGKHTETLVRSGISSLKSSLRKYGVVHYHAQGPGMFSFVSRLAGDRTVVSVQGLDWQRAKWSGPASFALRTAERIAARCADEIVVVSHQLRRYFQDTYGVEARYIPNGVNMVDDPATVSTTFISSLGLTPGKYLLFASRLVPEKGCHELIQAHASLPGGMKLVVAGSGLYQSGYEDSLKAMADPERVIFTGHLDGGPLQELFAHAYLFILPSHIEGMSNALLEALSYGKCAVVSDIPENVEVIGECGHPFRTGDAGALADTLRRLQDRPDLVRETEESVRQTLAGRYDWDTVALEHERLYARLGSGNGSGATEAGAR